MKVVFFGHGGVGHGGSVGLVDVVGVAVHVPSGGGVGK